MVNKKIDVPRMVSEATNIEGKGMTNVNKQAYRVIVCNMHPYDLYWHDVIVSRMGVYCIVLSLQSSSLY